MLYINDAKHKQKVDFIVNNKIMLNIVNFKSINDKLCIIELKCEWYNIIMISSNAPMEDKSRYKHCFLR